MWTFHDFFTELLSMKGKYAVKLSTTDLIKISRKSGNLIFNWPKLLRPFEGLLKPFFHVISMCMCSQCDSTSLPVQRSQI